ncbi:hypothetical protein jhhlp_001809 [Lomentospora prolificans]|uniref:Cytochrome P450 n=1 Tax=Lomentospora prolificans TaxID=41688 RepID=A0A2N3NGV5_9PEZI|nr:hypothetical protein jhhlp_001809 [Lomentospora prolificans]
MATAIDLQLPWVVVGGKNITYYLAIGAVLLLAWLVKQRTSQFTVEAPFYKASRLKWTFSAETLVLDSYKKFRDRVYQIKATEGVQVLIPANLVGELKGLPEDVLSATEAVSEVHQAALSTIIRDTNISQALQSRYTKFSPGRNGEMLATLVRKRLSQNLARLVPQLKDELEYITATEFPECKGRKQSPQPTHTGYGSCRLTEKLPDWTPFKFQPFSLRAVARMSGRAFVGPSINRQEQWMDTSINFAVHVFVAVVKLQLFPEWLRPLGQYFVSEIRAISRDLATARKLLEPVIRERLRDLDMPGYEKPPDDLIQWLIEALPEADKTDIAAQTQLQLILSAASIHTTNNLLTDCMYDLAARPEVQDMLREEAYQVLEVEQGWARKDSMAKLKKMDSFMKEVQRLSGNITSFIRKVIQPIDLSDGTHLPAGTKLLAPQAGFSRDPRFFPDPETFDALRFYKLRQQSDEDANRWQFTSINDTNMNFGAGRHACPGRFFAGNEVKMALAYFLLNYDIKLKEGETRPKPMMVVMSKAPDPNVELLFRRRSVEG